MGRELTDIHMDKKPNGIITKPNRATPEKVHVAPKISQDDIEEKDYEVKECTAEKPVVENHHEKQDVVDVSEDSIEKPGSHDKATTPTSKSASPASVRTGHSVSQPVALAMEKRASGAIQHHGGSEIATDGNNMPTPKKTTQPSSPLTSKKLAQLDYEDDNWSVSSSTAASARRVTIGSAPKFRCTERAEKRREFYSKLEQKHQALQAERSQCEQRQKEEQEAAIRQMRKSMVVKANPIPSFYYEAPPPKPELKKLPLTRPKSPKLNSISRRKSCGDTIVSDNKGKACARVQRHSFGSHRHEESSSTTATTTPTTARNKTRGQNVNSASKIKETPKQAKETKNPTAPKKMAEPPVAADIVVES